MRFKVKAVVVAAKDRLNATKIRVFPLLNWLFISNYLIIDKCKKYNLVYSYIINVNG